MLFFLRNNSKTEIQIFFVEFFLFISTSNHRIIPPNFLFQVFQKKKKRKKINRYPNVIKRTHVFSVEYLANVIVSCLN